LKISREQKIVFPVNFICLYHINLFPGTLVLYFSFFFEKLNFKLAVDGFLNTVNRGGFTQSQGGVKLHKI
jgi:hypothetical protein